MTKQRLVSKSAKANSPDDNHIIVKVDEKLYQVIVDCSPKYCKEVRTHMRDEGYKIRVSKNHTCGDHYGLKRFNTHDQAKRAVNALIRKFDTGRICKIRSITLNPYVGLIKVKIK